MVDQDALPALGLRGSCIRHPGREAPQSARHAYPMATTQTLPSSRFRGCIRAKGKLLWRELKGNRRAKARHEFCGGGAEHYADET